MVVEYEYAGTTTATATAAGDVAGYYKNLFLRRGEGGARVPQLNRQYFTLTVGDAAVNPTATLTNYRDTGALGR